MEVGKKRGRRRKTTRPTSRQHVVERSVPLRGSESLE